MDACISDEERRDLIELMNRSEDELLALTQDLDERRWTTKIADGVWSVAEVVEHLAKAEVLLMRVVKAALDSPPDPSWRESTAGGDRRAAQILADRTFKAQAPSPIRPLSEYTPAQTLALFRRVRERSRRFASETRSPLKAHTRPHAFPAFGVLNAYQWLLYIPYHQLRHNRQIEEVLQRLK